MYHCQFSIEDQHQIRHQRYHHPDPIVRKRMTILWHKHRGLPHGQIAELSDAAPNTVTATIRTYREQGLTGVQDRTFHYPPSQIAPYFLRLPHHPHQLRHQSLGQRFTQLQTTSCSKKGG